MGGMMIKKVVSFGYRHGQSPESDPLRGIVVIDIRKEFRNPFHDKKLRKLRGTHFAVQADIRKTPQFLEKWKRIAEVAGCPPTQELYLGCTSGHHRSVYLAELVGSAFDVPIEHRDFNKS
jgi:RNase adaptor protein for sRNA GlmZ degradation